MIVGWAIALLCVLYWSVQIARWLCGPTIDYNVTEEVTAQIKHMRAVMNTPAIELDPGVGEWCISWDAYCDEIEKMLPFTEDTKQIGMSFMVQTGHRNQKGWIEKNRELVELNQQWLHSTDVDVLIQASDVTLFSPVYIRTN
jgi:hypothetical protein